MRALPWWLVTLRLLLAPAVLLLTFNHLRGWWLTAAILVSLVSDIYDGRIARHYGVATEALRRYDSICDTIFYLSVAVSAWILERTALIAVANLLIAVAVLELVRYAFDFVKFRREASYHMWSAKLWGLFLAVSSCALLGWGVDGALLRTTLIIGILSDLEGLAISMVLPRWAHDVPTVFHALRMREQVMQQS